MKKLFRIALAACSALLLAACQPPESPPADHEVVFDRAQARWNAVISKEFETAYGFYSPGYRQQTDLVDFTIEMRSKPVQWMAADVISAACETDRCEVEVEVEYRVPSAPAQLSGIGSRRPVMETWIQVDDGWWFVPAS